METRDSVGVMDGTPMPLPTAVLIAGVALLFVVLGRDLCVAEARSRIEGYCSFCGGSGPLDGGLGMSEKAEGTVVVIGGA